MRVRSEHWQMLLQFCEKNPGLITNKFNGIQARTKANALWQTVAAKLNSLGYGEKSIEGWRKALTDWKSKTKSKAAALKTEMGKTGGGPNNLPPLSILEEKLLSIMGNKSVNGDEEVPELGFGNVQIKKTIPQLASEPGPSDQLFESTSTSADTKSVFQIDQDHDYGQENSLEGNQETQAGEAGAAKKRKLAPTPKVARRRPQQSLRVSSALLDLNRESVGLLKSLVENTERIATNTESIATSTESIATNTESIAISLQHIVNVLQGN